jgi:hypothetical protein
LFFAYLGGLVQARKQFIPGIFPFGNRYYNYFAGFKYILAGFVIGNVVSSFTFGHPFLLEDAIRDYYRKNTELPPIESAALYQ